MRDEGSWLSARLLRRLSLLRTRRRSSRRRVIFYWAGASGREYVFFLHRIGTKYKPVPGNYIFAKIDKNNIWVPLYIGEAEDLRAKLHTRLGHHENYDAIVAKHGATHLFTRFTRGDANVRRDIAADLRTAYVPAGQSRETTTGLELPAKWERPES